MSNTKTLILSEEEAKEFYPKAAPEFKVMLERSFGGKKFFIKNVMEIVKDERSAFDYLDRDYDSFLKICYDHEDEVDEIAHKELKAVAKCLQGDWVADYSNGNQKKWYPIFVDDGSGGFRFHLSTYSNAWAICGTGPRFCFPTQELADYFGKQFIKTHNKFLKLAA